jgi:SAM-dependent methyltransferase
MHERTQAAEFSAPQTNPTVLFDMVRWSHGSELLAAAVAHFDLFSKLAHRPMTLDEITGELGLSHRAATVLIVALRAMGLLAADGDEKLNLTPLAREHLVPGGTFYMGDYVGLSAENPGVKEMVQRLRTNKPAEARKDDPGAAFIYRDGMESAMDHDAPARRLTMALAGRARIVAPVLAQRMPLPKANRLLDIGGGTGLYSIGMLKANPRLRAVVWDRGPVLNVAREMAREHGVIDRMEFIPGDMFADPVPTGCDVMLLSNILHDWDVPECQRLLDRCAAALPGGGQLLIHDVYLNDNMDGPLPVALYSTALFVITEGRAYSAAEYRAMLSKAGLEPGDIIPTLVHCGVLPSRKK